MSIYIDSKRFEKSETVAIHKLPCEVCHDGDANVSTYFKSRPCSRSARYVNNTTGAVESTVDTSLSPTDPRPSSNFNSSSFRGRPLIGKNIEVPEGFTGVVLNEANKPFSEDEDRVLSVDKKFEKLTYWKLDGEPSRDDAFIKALDWIAIAESIHTDVAPQDPETPSSVDGLR